MTLDVIIATYKPEGIERVARMRLPEVAGVSYVISWQEHQDYPVPEVLDRPDVRVYRFDQKGVSRNRNNAIAHCRGDIIYMTDDDVEILPGALEKIRERFERYPDTEVATFMMQGSRGKFYPSEVTALSFYLPKNYNICTCEIAFRRSLFPDLKFDERYGPNSGVFEASEDVLFHLTARRSGYVCRFFPDLIIAHPHESTGYRAISDPRVLHGFGAVIRQSYPRTYLLRLPLKAWRLSKERRARLLPALRHLLRGTYRGRLGG